MTESSRYREEQGVRVIDVRAAALEQLFDNRDPAPYRDRDLDPDLAEYLYDAGEDLFGEPAIKIAVWLDKGCPPAEIEAALRAHFVELIAHNKRQRRRIRRFGQVTLLLAVVLVIAVIAAGQAIASAVPGDVGSGIKEGLTIFAWVAMWRPVEALLYDWIPARHERRVAAKLLAAPIELRSSAMAR